MSIRAGVRRLIVVVGVVGVLAALFIFGILRDPTRRDNIPSALLDKQTPDFSMPLFDRYRADYGSTFSSTSERGQPLVVNFWAWWCAPCREETPMLEASWQEHQDQVLFVGVHTLPRGNIQAANDFLGQYNVTYPNGRDEENRINIDYGLFGLPETFFIRADGTLSYRHSGPLTQEVLDEQIQALLSS